MNNDFVLEVMRILNFESTVSLNHMIFCYTTPWLHFVSNEDSKKRKGLWQRNEWRQICQCFRGILIIVLLYARAPWSPLSDSCCWVSHSRVLRFSFVSFPAVLCCLSAVIFSMSSLSISHFTRKKCLLIGLQGTNPGQVPSSRNLFFLPFFFIQS